MGRRRKGDDRYYLGLNALGYPAWLLREETKVGSAGSVTNLLGVASDNTSGFSQRGELLHLPKPSSVLVFDLAQDRDWSRRNLSGLDLREVWAKYPPTCINETDLSGCDLRGARFSKVEGAAVNLTGARTEGIVLDQWACLKEVKTDGTFDMTEVVLGKCEIGFAEPTRLVGLDTIGASEFGGWGTSAYLDNVDFSGETVDVGDLAAFVNISNGNFTGASFVSRDDNGNPVLARVEGTLFSECDFTDASMRDLECNLAAFEMCRFVGADLSGWKFDGANKFLGCDFTDADVSGWGFAGKQDWNEVAFRGQSVFDRADLSGVNEHILRSIVDSGLWDYERLSVRQAAERAGMDPEELGMLVWSGVVEARHNTTCALVSGAVDDSVHVPPWALKKLT